MKKWISYGILAALLLSSWGLFSRTGARMQDLQHQVNILQEQGDTDEEVAKLQSEIHSLEGQKTFNGILLAFLTSGLAGIVFVIDVLPMIAQRMTHAVYDSGEEVEPDANSLAHSYLAQGDYESAIASFKEVAEADPLNRLPWVEIAKIQKVHLHDPVAAVATLKEALEGQEWQVNDAAYLLFRIAELYDQDLNNRAGAVVTMQQVIEQFPESRHAANARHKLHEWGIV